MLQWKSHQGDRWEEVAKWCDCEKEWKKNENVTLRNRSSTDTICSMNYWESVNKSHRKVECRWNKTTRLRPPLSQPIRGLDKKDYRPRMRLLVDVCRPAESWESEREKVKDRIWSSPKVWKQRQGQRLKTYLMLLWESIKFPLVLSTYPAISRERSGSDLN